METQVGQRHVVSALEQGIKVLFCLRKAGREGLGISHIAKAVGLHRSRVLYILNTFALYGLVTRDSKSKRYRLGPGILPLSRKVLDDLDIRALASPLLKEVATNLNGTALLGLVDGDYLLIVERERSPLGIGMDIKLGHRFHITAGAHGKALFFHLKEEQRRRLIDAKRLYFFGPVACSMSKDLENQLLEARQKGFGIDKGEMAMGVKAVAAPIFHLDQRVYGALIVYGGFEEEFLEEVGQYILKKASQLESSIWGLTFSTGGVDE